MSAKKAAKPKGWRAKATVWMPDGARISVDTTPPSWAGRLLLVLLGASRVTTEQRAELWALSRAIEAETAARYEAEKAGHTPGGNCWKLPGSPQDHDVCERHSSPRGDCSVCPRCAPCDAEHEAAKAAGGATS